MAGIELAPVAGRFLGAEVCDRVARPRRDPPAARRRGRVDAAAEHYGRTISRCSSERRPQPSERLSMTGYFVTGTDTGVGKTHVTQALARCARPSARRSSRSSRSRPAARDRRRAHRLGPGRRSGRRAGGGSRATFVASTSSLAGRAARRRRGGGHADRPRSRIARTLERRRLRRPISRWSREPAVGGSRSRRARHERPRPALGLPVVIVARATLGTINHTLLTIEAVERDGCAVAALVLSRRPEDSLEFTRSNARQIARRWAGPSWSTKVRTRCSSRCSSNVPRENVPAEHSRCRMSWWRHFHVKHSRPSM